MTYGLVDRQDQRFPKILSKYISVDQGTKKDPFDWTYKWVLSLADPVKLQKCHCFTGRNVF